MMTVVMLLLFVFAQCKCMFLSFIASKKELKEHEQKTHRLNIPTLQCDQCDFVATKRANYKQHMKTHLAPELKEFKCDMCTYSSNSKEGLEMHENSVHKG